MAVLYAAGLIELMFSVGLNGSPFTPDYAIVKWTDSSTTAIPSLRYIGFTAGKLNVHCTNFLLDSYTHHLIFT